MSSERIQRRIERLLGRAKAAADRNDWEESRRLTDDIFALDPENADAQAYIVAELQLRIESLLIQAQAAAERSDWEESRQAAELVLAMDPDNAIAQSYVLRAGQGTIEHLLDQVEEAADLRDWDQVRLFAGDILALDPDNVDAQTYNAAADRMLNKIELPKKLTDELQKGHYEIVVDEFSGVATVSGNKFTVLPKNEFAILASLYRNRGRVASLQQIRDECSSFFYFETPTQANEIIERCIKSLRSKIEEDPSNPKIIRDVGHFGDSYIIAPVVEQTATVLDTGDIVLPELPEGSSREAGQAAPVEPSELRRTPGDAPTPITINRDFDSLYKQGTAFLDQDLFEKARICFDHALLLKPNEPDALFLRAVALEGLEDPAVLDQALADCNQAIKIRPRYPNYLWVRARLLLALGRYEESLADVDRAMQLGPGIFDSYSVQQFYFFAATASMIMVDDLRREALEFLKRAIACEPEKYRDLASLEQDFDLLRDDPQYGAQFRELVSTR